MIAILSCFLVTEGLAHLVAWLPCLILLLCPLRHLFMHHGHGLLFVFSSTKPRAGFD
ncbi:MULTISPECIES: DUF2933 domain-containing protein [Marinobacterium]|uniref:DUF2933 domain-containing protein n=1 Tax=Marinobacterium TaxID=48075 RepID=UPI0031344FC2